MNTEIMALVKDIQDRVREVAYMMWESAGRQHGMAMNYWLAAERDVIETMQAAAERMIPAEPPSEGEAAASPAPRLNKPAAEADYAASPAPEAAPPPTAASKADAPAGKAEAPAGKAEAPAGKEPAKPAAKTAPRKTASRAKAKTQRDS